MIKKFKKLKIFFLLVLLTLLYIEINNVYAHNIENDILENVYVDVDINDNFDETSVIVVLDYSISGINKIHNDKIFKNINYSKIKEVI